MDQSPPPLEHRHKRRALWARLWLARLVRLLSECAAMPMPDLVRSVFDQALSLMAKLVVFLVLIRAAQLKAPPAPGRNPRQIALAMRRHDVRVIERGGMRAAIGGRLRRAVKFGGYQAKDFKTRAEKLIRVLNALDFWAAAVAHRARNGLTRLLALYTGVYLPLPRSRAEAQRAKAGLFLRTLARDLRVTLALP